MSPAAPELDPDRRERGKRSGVGRVGAAETESTRKSKPGVAASRRRGVLLISGSASLLGAVSSLLGQTLHVRVLDAEARVPIAGAVVRLMHGDSVAALGLTDMIGTASLRGMAPGKYVVRLSRIAFTVTETWRVTLAAGEARQLTLLASSAPVELPTITVKAESRCTGLGADRTAGARLWEQIHTALLATEVTQAGPQRYRRRQFSRELTVSGVVRAERLLSERVATGPPFKPLAPRHLATRGFAEGRDDRLTYFAPDASILLSDWFVASHCFWIVRPPDSLRGHLGLAFKPSEAPALTDISGLLWVDRETSELRVLEFEFMHPPQAAEPTGARGWIWFSRHPSGQWYISSWAIRMPRVGLRRSDHAGLGGTETRQLLGYVEAGGSAVPLERVVATTSAVLTGSVVDSLTGHALPNVVVRLAGSPDSVLTDSLGTFVWRVPLRGRRVLTFGHPLFDLVPSRGTVDVELTPGVVTHVQGITPGARSIAADACAGTLGANGALGVLTGPKADSTILQAVWYAREGSNSIRRTTELTTTDARGLWVFCDLQGARAVTIQWREPRSEARSHYLSLAPNEFRWVELAVHQEIRALTLSGKVIDRQTQAPLSGVEVVLLEHDRHVLTRTDGSFSVPGVPVGVHVVLARHPGYFGLDTTIALRDGSLAVLLAVERAPTILPEVSVEARESRLGPRMRAVEERRRTTLGRFIPRDFLSQREHSTLGVVLDAIPRVTMINVGTESAAASSLQTNINPPTYERPWPPACYLQVFMDGIRVWSPGGVNRRPYNLNQHSLASLGAIEVYTGADTPPEFSGTGSSCGTVVLWTRER